jgi:hypothetical protein
MSCPGSPPPHFSGPGSYPAAVNDAGDQVRSISTSSQFLPYLFDTIPRDVAAIWGAPPAPGALWRRLDHEGRRHHGNRGGIGLIAWAQRAGQHWRQAFPAYSGGDVTVGGPISNFGRFWLRVVGRSPRLVTWSAESARAVVSVSLRSG